MMKTQTINKAVRLGLCLTLMCLTVLGRPSWAQDLESWTTVAAAGTVNESDLAEVVLSSDGVASLVNGPEPATAVIRYNVVYTRGLRLNTERPNLRVRFADNGGAARVRVFLFRSSFVTGLSTKLAELDSDDYAPAGGMQLQTVAGLCPAADFDSDEYSYFIEVHLIRSAAQGSPKLKAMQIFTGGGCAQ